MGPGRPAARLLRSIPPACAMAVVAALAAPPALATGVAAAPVDFSSASIVVPAGESRRAERLAADVLREEIARRTGLSWPVVSAWPDGGPVIAIAAGAAAGWPAPDGRAEGYRLASGARGSGDVIWVVGADARGALFGVGGLLRALSWAPGAVALDAPLDVSTAPTYPIRGHQLGYRQHSNTYDGWDEAQYDRYIRELALLGANAVENIPFQDARPSPLMPLPREVMNRRLSAICDKYGLQYWLWTPADFDLGDAGRRAAALAALDALFAELPRLDAIFLPGGDPGDNPAPMVVPYLRDVAAVLARSHPDARVWLSLQHFDAAEIDFVFAWIDREHPEWLGGLVAGPGSPPIPDTRRRLDRRYRLRDYPDITHTVRSQYPVPWWDPAFAFTLGREPVNPRPVFYAAVHDAVAPGTSGFVSYSDGVNDDFNKALWTRKAWDPDASARAIAVDYGRLFFGAAVADRVADGLLALERNWHGPLARNDGVEATLALWRGIEAAFPDPDRNWRLQMHLMRAYYDAYTRRRLLHETALEDEALEALAAAPRIGASEAMARAARALSRATDANCCPEWRQQIVALCDALFASIRMQTSISRHRASGPERGAVLDFVDHPLNNRWWLEDQFPMIRALPDEPSRLRQVARLAAWSRPGPGSFYDDVGDVGNSPRVVRGGAAESGGLTDDAIPHFTWEGGASRRRLSWQTSLRWPKGIVYTGLDPAASYVVRLNVLRAAGPGDVRLRIDGQPAVAARPARAVGDLMEFDVPPALVRDGRIALTFDEIDESHVNWREYSRLAEAWVIRR